MEIERALQKLRPISFDGVVRRIYDAEYGFLETTGSYLFGGRWNRRQRYGALYTALDKETAVKEIRHMTARRGRRISDLGPRCYVEMRVRLTRVFGSDGLLVPQGAASYKGTTGRGQGALLADCRCSPQTGLSGDPRPIGGQFRNQLGRLLKTAALRMDNSRGRSRRQYSIGLNCSPQNFDRGHRTILTKATWFYQQFAVVQWGGKVAPAVAAVYPAMPKGDVKSPVPLSSTGRPPPTALSSSVRDTTLDCCEKCGQECGTVGKFADHNMLMQRVSAVTHAAQPVEGRDAE